MIGTHFFVHPPHCTNRGTHAQNVKEVYDERTFDKKTKLPEGVSQIDFNVEEYDEPVLAYLIALRNERLKEDISPEVYSEKVANLTPKTVAIELKKLDKFKNRSLKTLAKGVELCSEWINHPETLDIGDLLS